MLFLEVGTEQLPLKLRRETFDVSKVANDGSVTWVQDHKVARISRFVPTNKVTKKVI